MCFGYTVELGGNCTGGDSLFYLMLLSPPCVQSILFNATKSSLCFNVPEYLGQFVFEFVGGVLRNRIICVGVY